MNKLNLNRNKIAACRNYSKIIAADLQKIIDKNTTVSVERSILRLFGVDGVDKSGLPYPNILAEKIKEAGVLQYGAANVMASTMIQNRKNFKETVSLIILGKVKPLYVADKRNKQVVNRLSEYGISRVEKARKDRAKLQAKNPTGKGPWFYLIVATGNIYEDVKQARSAALNGANCIAVIRSTAQSLMDYVPYGATTTGFGGTYATQENFRIMRKALDEISVKLGRYIYLVNYCSGLCMCEIAAMGAMERLDMMLNDSMYGIIFRDINMYRTFIDQHFSRMINTQAGIIINTGEDNYLTTADAVKQAHTVLASEFINERLAKNAGMPEKLMGLGHAFEINPDIKNSFLLELAQAQMVREIFPESPIKYMPPTKHITGDIFKAHVIDSMFNLASVATNQSIHLLGILTEGIHTPFIQDRYLSIESAKYVMNAAKDMSTEVTFRKNGLIQKRANEVLDKALKMLGKIKKEGLLNALEQGCFADIKRPRKGGKGFEGVIAKAKEYTNPFEERWSLLK
ncbi:MAG: D-lysine 5,6-aminomutase subunit alpha [Candidatus Firestonebacteria bacterium RIFOXYC2_FULL_39_67]|nr:MAG: D-lysine 5,6-aminomutase subunit alpha [Candidatus Firestonebacteria bacterium RIFOXYD2_FULL_39_29]OGF56141.1 MAG: D-lysine 5,6-aminomutase subunit alpha [Candidatus Firestonebacteria bacterium RIFOXYC2_FULL_39_67]